MIDFKDFIDLAGVGDVRHDLFIVPVHEHKEVQRVLARQAIARGFKVHHKQSSGTVEVGNAKARFITPHKYAAQMVVGHEFTAINGEHLLDGEPEVLARLKAQIRP